MGRVWVTDDAKFQGHDEEGAGEGDRGAEEDGHGDCLSEFGCRDAEEYGAELVCENVADRPREFVHRNDRMVDFL